MAIKFDHAVKYHGKWYAAGETIEEPAQKAAEADENAEETKAEEDVEAKEEPAQKAAKGRKKAAGDAK